MTTIPNFQTSLGKVDTSLISPDQIAALDPERQALIRRVIDTVAARVAAEQRLAAARVRVRLAMAAEDDAHAAHVAASPPVTYSDIRAQAIAAYNQK